MTPRKIRQQTALGYVRRYADHGRMEAVRVWLRRLSRLGPLSPIQVHNLRKRIDPDVLAEFGLGLVESNGPTQMMAALEKRLGPA